MNSQTQRLIDEEFKELTKNREDDFRRAVRQKLNDIAAVQARLVADQSALDKLRKELRELEHTPLDRKEIIGTES